MNYIFKRVFFPVLENVLDENGGNLYYYFLNQTLNSPGAKKIITYIAKCVKM